MFGIHKAGMTSHKIIGRMVALCVLALLCLLVVPCLRAETPPEAVVVAAEKGLARYLNAIPENQLEDFGFTNKEEFAGTTIGSPFRVYIIPATQILSFKDGDDLCSLIMPTSLWLCPVICSGRARVLLNVDLMGGEWRAVGLSASYLASEMEGVAGYLAKFEGYERKYVRVYQAGSEFVLMSRDKECRLIPLRSAALVLGLARKGETYEYGTIAPSEAISRLAPIVKKNLGAWQQR